MKRIRRFIALVLTLLMTLPLCVTAAFADGSAEVNQTGDVTALAEDYRGWTHHDPRWSNILLNTQTMGQCGCLITATIKLIIQAGFKTQEETDPGIFANWLITHNGISTGNDGTLNLMSWYAPTNYAPGLTWEGRHHTGNGIGSTSSDAVQNAIINYIEQGYHVLLSVWGSTTNGQHWVVVDEASTLLTGNVRINDTSGQGDHPEKDIEILLSGRYTKVEEISLYSGGSTTPEPPPSLPPVIIIWENWDGRTLSQEIYEGYDANEKPVYSGETPVRPADEEYTYTFSGWDPEIKPLSEGNQTYTAQFTKQPKENPKFTVIWKNYDGTVLETDYDVPYGEIPVYNGVAPEKPATAQYTYHFDGWTPDVAPVTGNTTYTAKYTSTVNSYTVRWKNYDGTVLETDYDVPYGEIPVYNGAAPEKPATAQYTYHFDGWTPEVAPVTGNTAYTAKYTSTVNTYTVRWKNYDGTVLETDYDVLYGEIPVYNGAAPEKPATAQYTYHFDGWTPEVAPVTGNTAYTAKYTSTVNTYTVRWKNYNGTVLETDYDVPYGEIPVYNGEIPLKPEDDHYTYVFETWSPTVSMVTGDTCYTASFTPTPKLPPLLELQGLLNVEVYCTRENSGHEPVIFDLLDGTYELGEVTGNPADGWECMLTIFADKYIEMYNDEYPNLHELDAAAPDGACPRVIKLVHNLTVDTWQLPENSGSPVKFAVICPTYTVTWVGAHNTVLETDEVIVNTMPVYHGETPENTYNDEYECIFVGWLPKITPVTCDITYRAIFYYRPVTSPDEPKPVMPPDNSASPKPPVTGFASLVGIGISAVLSGAGITVFRRKRK